MKIELSRVERQILVNQLEILQALGLKGRKYDEAVEILNSGYEVFYSDAFTVYDESLSYDDGRFVLDVLSMYREIHFYVAQHPDDKETRDHRMAYLHGFDGNNETAQMAFVRFLLHDQKKFQELLAYKSKTDDFNSHAEMVSRYRPMVMVWKSIDRSVGFEGLTKEQIMSVLNAT